MCVVRARGAQRGAVTGERSPKEPPCVCAWCGREAHTCRGTSRLWRNVSVCVFTQRTFTSPGPWPLSPGLFNLCNGCFNFCNGYFCKVASLKGRLASRPFGLVAK